MQSASGRWVICYNGEIYNFQVLARELEASGQAPAWRGRSDTEVIVAAVEAWGVIKAVSRLVGIFALALWDREERVLWLARDPMGVKPLFFGEFRRAFIFGSELKALRAHPSFDATIDRNALAIFLRRNFVPAPYSIYAGVEKLTPGTILSVRHERTGGFRRELHTCWSTRQVFERGATDPLDISPSEAVDLLDRTLGDVVASQMVSDVPLGSFLSGGIDSSTVTALMQSRSSRPIKTFSIGFEASGYDEAPHARAIARYLGTEHTELYVTPGHGLATIPELPRIWDEPFSDASQVPTYLLAHLTRRHVTVSLSGDGGDELFCGYVRYGRERAIWRMIGWAPLAARRVLAAMVSSISPQTWNRWLPDSELFRSIVGKGPGHRLHRLADVLRLSNQHALFNRLMSHWPDPGQLVIGATEPETALTDPAQWAKLATFEDQMMYLDMISYLPDDILVKLDRASMAVGLEARVPLLDQRVVELAARLPLAFKMRGGQTKWVLRQVLSRYVPPRLFSRPKMGFTVPLESWLRGPLHDWAKALLDEKRLEREGYLRPSSIREKWLEHVAGTHDWHNWIWDVLMFQAWLEQSSS